MATTKQPKQQFNGKIMKTKVEFNITANKHLLNSNKLLIRNLHVARKKRQPRGVANNVVPQKTES